MRILIAPDKFKNSLSAQGVCDALEQGLKKRLGHVECIKFPLADGGEGTQEILTHHLNGEFIRLTVHDPLFRKVEAQYGISQDRTTAVIEMASASGLHLLAPSEINVMETSTVGTGELIRDAVDRGVSQIILGIGGSATNDGATGAASVLGFYFSDEGGKPILPKGKNLIHIRKIDARKIHSRLRAVKFTAMCDVDNPFTGPRGAAAVYAPQKGATEEQVVLLDDGMKQLAKVIQADLGVAMDKLPGAGAGGGMGGGMVAFFNATLKKGIDVVFEITQFEQQVKEADVIITGEGKMDLQTLHGKVVAGVASLAKKYNKRVIGVTGRNELTTNNAKQLGVNPIFSLTDYASKEVAIKEAFHLIVGKISDDIAETL